MINLDVINPDWLHEPKIEVEKSDFGPPGPPPREGLQWKVETHRWIRPHGIKEVRFHSLTSVSDEQAKKILLDMKANAVNVLPWVKTAKAMPDDPVTKKAMWCLEVFEEAMYHVGNTKDDETHSFVYANDSGIPEVACVWSLFTGSGNDRDLSVEFLATNPKNFKESKAKDKTKGLGTAAIYKVFEEAVRLKATKVILSPEFDSAPFYSKLGFKPDKKWNKIYEISINDVKARLIEAGMLQKDTDLEELIKIEDEVGAFVGQPDQIMKAQGVAEAAGPPPGAPPRPGLSWKYSTHRWIRPEDGKARSGLKIPPGWSDVWINEDPTADVQVIARDSQGRQVKLTTAEHKGKASAIIFARVKELTPRVPELRDRFAKDSDTIEEAAVMYALAKTGLRIGSDKDTKAKVKAYGISTLKPEHVKVNGNKVTFEFVAKKGILVKKTVEDPKLADIFSERLKSGGDIFDTSYDQVRHYFHSLPDMDHFEIKDFRTYVGIQTALKVMAGMAVPADRKQFIKQRMEVGRLVAAELGNTPATSLKYYIAPEVFLNWQSNISEFVKKSFDPDQAMSDFVETTIYMEDIPWKDMAVPEDPDDDDDDELIKAKRFKRPIGSKPPEDNPTSSPSMGYGPSVLIQDADDSKISIDPSYGVPESLKKPKRVTHPGPPPGPPPRAGLKWKPETHRWTVIWDLPKTDGQTQYEKFKPSYGVPAKKWNPGRDRMVDMSMLYPIIEESESEVWHREDNPLFDRKKSERLRELTRAFPIEAQNLMLLLQTYVESADPNGHLKEEKMNRAFKILEDNVPRIMGWTIDRYESADEAFERNVYKKKFKEIEDLVEAIEKAKYGDLQTKIIVLDKIVTTAHVVEPSLLPQFAGVGLMHHGVDFTFLQGMMRRYMDWLSEEVKCYDVYYSDLMKARTIVDLIKAGGFVPGQKYNPPKPRSKFYTETPDSAEVYKQWAKERLDRGRKLIVETKFNGFRTTVSKDQSKVDIWFEDSEHSRVKAMPDVASELSRIGLDFILDGETMIYKGDKPIARIHMMKLMANDIRLEPGERVVIALFDIVYLKKDLSQLPLIERKRILRKFFNEHLDGSTHFVLSDYSLVDDEKSFTSAVHKMAKQPASEGAVIKDAEMTFKQGLTDDWAKVKTVLELKVRVLAKKEAGAAFVYECGLLID